MTTTIGINGFGRIGRMVFRKAITDPELDVVAINATYPAETLAHLIKYDSVHGYFNVDIEIEEQALIVNGRRVRLLATRDPLELPWGDLGVDVVIEATGKFRDREGVEKHFASGAKKVVLTAPGKEEDVTIVMGVNEHVYDPERHHFISNASCTTNCLAPIAKVIDQHFGIEQGLMTTVHSFTNDQRNLDNPHKDLRRARACAQSIIPTTTGAAKAVGKVLPNLAGKLNGLALRVPTPNVSIVDLVVDVRESVTVEHVNRVLKEASEGELRGIIQYTEEPLVSIDYVGNEHSAIVDGLSTMVMGEKQLKVLAWYDNEWGYSCRVVDLVKYIGRTMGVVPAYSGATV
ncbi:glyceraldehyde-3-phosphate dehydrogenase, type I [Caldalkalibacillus thermarum TA2.A1]|uniref:Glyceraldehyde-3-phosphate dehydrogenase n=1 Tax=Caldalkalibacillus thermarum (strain TA2.A1) TaxID=986075 RepID=F5L954_CALTT|nr:glyceraldehyde-3-phosphate dehydrogenase [Caldalkalibacillus thermarum]EGL82128.1 glyceraldehyde-3-phosphate dehydrogenase, type I [Caldalkalibacillus thermarum TA2.A1]QZT34955.1 glyceraldehyde-3-phosphate dehydrogenase [Caldalkalibacillus thermarum TA2.A1]